MKDKEFLYVGHYIDTKGRYILKIGTTNDLERRRQEHNARYRSSRCYQMPEDEFFHYDWWLPLSKYNTLRYEDSNRQKWIEENFGKFVRNDRFACASPPKIVEIKIKKVYRIALV